MLQGKQSNHSVTSRPLLRTNWAASWQNQQCGCAPSEDSDQPGHPPSLNRVFAVRLMGSLGPKLSSCGQRMIWVLDGRTATLLVLSRGGSNLALCVRRQSAWSRNIDKVWSRWGKAGSLSVWENSLHSFSFCRKSYWTSTSYLIKSMK